MFFIINTFEKINKKNHTVQHKERKKNAINDYATRCINS